MNNTRTTTLLLFVLVTSLIAAGCSEGVFTGEKKDNIPPVVTLTSSPIERSLTSYKIHLYWDAADPDGKIRYCQYCIVSGDPYGFSPSDTMGADKWTNTIDESGANYNDRLFRFSCDSIPSKFEFKDKKGSFDGFEKTHTFFIRAVDGEWAASKVQHVSFTSWTLAPTVKINEPIGDQRVYSSVITFGWNARDPIDHPDNIQNPEDVRYMLRKIDLVRQLDLPPPWSELNPQYYLDEIMNEFPELFKDEWEDWIKYSLSDSGSSVKVGPLETSNVYFFAMQARDEAGAVTALMEMDVNLRVFSVSRGNYPDLVVSEKTIGRAQFVGFGGRALEVKIPPGVELNFSWSAGAEHYGGRVTAYRYGWDVNNLDNPNEWDSGWGLEHRNTTKTYYTGVHNLYVQVRDDGQRVTTGVIRIQVIPFDMENDLLLVDDWACSETTDFGGMTPREDVHDQFLKEIIQERVPSFVAEDIPEGDIYDFRDKGAKYITIDDISNYKNMIWIYGDIVSTTGDETSNWRENIYFIPDSEPEGEANINLIKLFLRAGGHLLSYGKSGTSFGGLSDVYLDRENVFFPSAISEDLVDDENDLSWRNCMPYDDYGANVLDRIRNHYSVLYVNAMKRAVLERDDPVTAMYPNLPDTLKIREDLTSNGRYWDEEAFGRDRCGLWFVETFNGPGHMEKMDIYNVPEWFHPMYRMRACKSNSMFDNAPVAMIMTRNANIQPFADGGIMANSFHFGFPLWYFERDSVEKIFDVIFTEWRIKQ